MRSGGGDFFGGATDEFLEVGDGLGEDGGLAVEVLGSGGGFLGAGGIGLGDLVHLRDGDGDLADALALLGGGGGDFADEGVELEDLLLDAFEAAGDLGATPEELDRSLDLLDPVLSVLGTSRLRPDGGTIDRDDFTAQYFAALCVMTQSNENAPDAAACDAALGN